MTLDELMDNVFEGKSAVIENLLYTGAYILAGAPKIGKSFLVAQIAHHISTGQDLWGYPFAAVANREDLNGLEKFRQSILLNQRDSDRMAMTVQSMSILKNPRFLVEMIQDNQRELTPPIQRFLEEGVEDGSIRTEYAKELAEIIPLLTGLWMVPDLYPATAEEMMRKFRFIGDLLARMGVPLVDEALLEELGPYFRQIEEAGASE